MILQEIPFITPQIIVVATAIILLIANSFKKIITVNYIVSQIFLILACIVELLLAFKPQGTFFDGTMLSSYHVHLVQGFMFFSLFLIFLYAKNCIQQLDKYNLEFYVLLLLSTVGATTSVSANNFIVLYIGIELMSLSIYSLIILSSSKSDHTVSCIATMNYFIFNVVSTCFLLYGLSFIYGVTGSLDFVNINMSSDISSVVLNSKIYLFSLTLVVLSLMVKLGVSPFHFWVYDLYSASSKYLIVFISTIPKLTYLMILFNFFFSCEFNSKEFIVSILNICAVISILFGSISAFSQKSFKKLLAYSSISQTGFILLCFNLSNERLLPTFLLYSIHYLLVMIAFWGILILLSSKTNSRVENISQISGLYYSSPWISFLFLVLIGAMLGLPPFSGFVTKVVLIINLIHEESYYIAFFSSSMTLFSSLYLIRIVKSLFVKKSLCKDSISINETRSFLYITIHCMFFLFLGIYPKFLTTVLS